MSTPSPRDDAAPSPSLSVVSLRAQAAEFLQQRMVAGYYTPGQRLSEAAIAEELAISRGPLREALQQLGSRGLLRHTTNRGWSIPEFTPVEIQQLYEVREALEGMAARLAAQRRTPDDIKALKSVLAAAQAVIGQHGEGYPQGERADLHALIAAIARNPMLQRRIRETQQQLALARYRSAASTDRATSALAEHQRILEAVEHGRAATAQRLTVEHIRNSAHRALGATTS